MARRKAAAEETRVKEVLDEVGNGFDMQEETITPLTRNEVAEAATFNREKALALVGMYYAMQKLRVGSGNRVSAHERRVDILADSDIVKRIQKNLEVNEKQCGRALAAYAKSQPLGRWCLSILGIGPVITAGFLAHIDIQRAKTAGAIWRFSGMLDPEDLRWEKGQRRPYNLALKTLCFKAWEGFKKASVPHTREEILGMPDEKKRKLHLGRLESFLSPAGLYSRLYVERKKLEVLRNEQGENQERAARFLADFKKRHITPSDEQRACWEAGKLQPVGLDRRAGRKAIRLFLSHYHHVGWMLLTGDVPVPYVFAYQGDKHVHFIEPPCQEVVRDLYTKP